MVYVLHITNFLGGLHFKWRGLQTYWPATTHTHYPYHTSQVLWSQCMCWSICGPQLHAQIECVSLPRDWNHRSGRPCQTWLWTVESDIAPLNIGLATAYYWAQNRQAWSTLNDNIYWTSHMMTMMMHIKCDIVHYNSEIPQCCCP